MPLQQGLITKSICQNNDFYILYKKHQDQREKERKEFYIYIYICCFPLLMQFQIIWLIAKCARLRELQQGRSRARQTSHIIRGDASPVLHLNTIILSCSQKLEGVICARSPPTQAAKCSALNKVKKTFYSLQLSGSGGGASCKRPPINSNCGGWGVALDICIVINAQFLINHNKYNLLYMAQYREFAAVGLWP